jgi:chemotaxis protein MotA
MDIASIIGMLIGLGSLGAVLYEASHGHLVMFYSLEGVLMVGGGTISVCFMAMPMNKLKCLVGFLKRFMFHKSKDPIEAINLMRGLAEKARRDGALALQSEYTKLEHTEPFLAAGIRMIVDGITPEAVEATLRIDILAMQERHKIGKKFFDLIKLYGPGWALVGTLVGQIAMFGNLSAGDPAVLGKALAIAVCATMYGTILANAIAEEIQGREMMLQGLLSMHAGDNPRITIDKMAAYLPPINRLKLAAAA